jgi:hypothetical protein
MYSTLDESTYSTYTSASEDVHLIFQSLIAWFLTTFIPALVAWLGRIRYF